MVKFCHQNRVNEASINTHRIAPYTLAHEANFFIKPNCPIIIRMNRKLDPGNPCAMGIRHNRVDQFRSITFSAMRRQQPHSQNANMSMNRALNPDHITPSHNFIINNRHTHRISLGDHLRNKLTGLRQRWCLQIRKKFALACNNIQNAMHFFRVFLRHSNNLQAHIMPSVSPLTRTSALFG